MTKARTILVTGSAGLIGSETVRRFAADGCTVVGIDNDMRKRFFGEEASTRRTRDELLANVPDYQHHEIDIRDAAAVNDSFPGSTAGAWRRSCTPRRSRRTIGQRAIRRWTLRSMPTARSICSKRREISARKRPSFLLRRTRSTATRRTACRCANCHRVGKSNPGTNTNRAFPRT